MTDTNHWGTFLIAVKLVGVLVTAAAALLGALSEAIKKKAKSKRKRTEPESKVTFEAFKPLAEPQIEQSALVELLEHFNIGGKKFIIFVISSVIITVAAQVADIILEDNEKDQSKTEMRELLAKTSQQLARSDQTIKLLSPLATRFRELSVEASYEFPASAFALEDLVTDEVRSKIYEAQAYPLDSRSTAAKNESPTTSLLWSFGESKHSVWVTIDRNLNNTVTTFKLNEAQLFAREKTNEQAHVAKKIMEVLKSHGMTVRLWNYGDASPDPNDPDKDVPFKSSSTNDTGVTIEWVYPSNRLRLTWKTDFPQAAWQKTENMSDMTHLDRATMQVDLDDCPQIETGTPLFWFSVNVPFGIEG